MSVKEQIISRLRATNCPNIEKVIEYMEKNKFFFRGCNRHHHYTGGLADHAWQTYQVALQSVQHSDDATALSEDSIAICTILHDLCNCSGMGAFRGHGRRSARIIKELGFKLTQQEFFAIRFHMGLHNKQSHPFYADACKSRLLALVHKADGRSAGMIQGSEVVR